PVARIATRATTLSTTNAAHRSARTSTWGMTRTHLTSHNQRDGWSGTGRASTWTGYEGTWGVATVAISITFSGVISTFLRCPGPRQGPTAPAAARGGRAAAGGSRRWDR